MKTATVAVIQEDLCIGCTKCITACPVDAIIGASKHMHTVIADECIGCDLCVPACPMDCIDIQPTEHHVDKAKSKQRAKLRKQRMAAQAQQALNKKTKDQRMNYIQQALAREASKHEHTKA